MFCYNVLQYPPAYSEGSLLSPACFWGCGPRESHEDCLCVDHSLDVVLGQANPADEATVEVLDATLLALGLRYPEQCREVNNELGQLSGRNHGKNSDDTAWWETNSEADS